MKLLARLVATSSWRQSSNAARHSNLNLLGLDLTDAFDLWSVLLSSVCNRVLSRTAFFLPFRNFPVTHALIRKATKESKSLQTVIKEDIEPAQCSYCENFYHIKAECSDVTRSYMQVFFSTRKAL
ncbi:conserved hypothetical protein [Culex quinquefasciatus]|uniref:Uncharacterized protein n=1 Tax=Culex quinquefasciatus TaxID=7176 RepID=B0WJP5_CULQU|nr:conserved hypothetical protein [Culex quinquefasciatus]|eukprot:XP_001848929.1 conserved hypothetical protein [Culex quinquefasciatus]